MIPTSPPPLINATPAAVSIIDLNAFGQNAISAADALAPLRSLCSPPRPIKIAHHAKFDANLSAQLGADLGGIFDTLLASQLIGAGDIEERHGLETVASRYLNEAVDKTERLSNWNFELSEAQLEYAARDAAVLIPLREKLIERIRADSLIDCAQLEFECVMTVADMELTGFYMHKDRGWNSCVVKRDGRTRDELHYVWRRSSQDAFRRTPP